MFFFEKILSSIPQLWDINSCQLLFWDIFFNLDLYSKVVRFEIDFIIRFAGKIINRRNELRKKK